MSNGGSLRLPEFFHPARVERVLGVCMAVPLQDDFLVDEQVVFSAEYERQEPAVPVPAGRVRPDVESHALAFQEAGSELAGFLAEALDRLARILGLGSINADEPDCLGMAVDLELDGITVDNFDDVAVRVKARSALAALDLAVPAPRATRAGWARALARAFLGWF